MACGGFTAQNKHSTITDPCGSMRKLSFQASHLRSEEANRPQAAGGSPLEQGNSPGQLDSVGNKAPAMAAPLVTTTTTTTTR